jgi:hypothetical protein
MSALAPFVAALMMACGDSESGGEAATEIPDPTAESYTEPTGYETFTSKEKGYSIAYPEEWTAVPDFAKIGAAQTDQFVGPERDGKTTNVGVSNCQDPGDLSSDEFLTASLAPFAEGAEGMSDPEEVTTRSGTGELVEFEFTFGSVNLDYSFFALVDGECGRVIALACGQGERANYDRIFRTMISSLQNTKGNEQEL